jgi:hypothetical protein
MFATRFGIWRFFMKIAASLAALLVTWLTVAVQLAADEKRTVDLAPRSPDSDVFQVTSRLDGRGTVSPETDTNVPLRLDARFEYGERIISRQPSLKSIRDYKSARAEIRLGNGSMINELDETNRRILVQSNRMEEPVRIASLAGPLTQSEFEVVSTPASTLILGELVRRNDVAEGTAWQPDKHVLARFLNIDAIDETDVELKLEKLDGNIAKVFIGGTTRGWIDDAATELGLAGVIVFDVAQGLATTCELTINQQRDMSRLHPGLDATFRMNMKVAPGSPSPHLTDDGLAALRKNAGKITNDLRLLTADGAIELMHTLNWRVIGRERERSVLRLIESCEMLGQCDIIALPPRSDDKPQTLEQFRKVVETKLEASDATVTDTRQGTSPNGLEWMRITASGGSNGVPLIWNYYTITHADGRRVQLVFTTEPDLATRFNSEFDSLLSRIQFRDAVPASNAGFTQ